jgi:hypothetical protein
VETWQRFFDEIQLHVGKRQWQLGLWIYR